MESGPVTGKSTLTSALCSVIASALESALKSSIGVTTHPTGHAIVTSPNSTTAAERVFKTPELMAMILDQFVGKRRRVITGNPLGFADLTSLQRCSLVNRYWCLHVMRIFWRNPTPPRSIPQALHGYLESEGPFQTSLVQRFSGVKEGRRPFYANWVLKANLMVVQRHELREASRLFHGFTFPKLRTLVIFLDQGTGDVYLPVIIAPNLSRIEVDLCKFRTGPSDQYVAWEMATRGPQRRAIAKLADIIRDRYASARHVVFKGGMTMGKRTFKKFKKELPAASVMFTNPPGWWSEEE
ncbi:uncharacterized protein N7458_006382 [Penicillium daleae]|uniref:Uncharacterized protein n=1 Tax=Penicillium daleae TaxID=63821 RepID=A0AAD6C6Z8_9EURO|nr:uncharacterized protein N7458_006382 [Penicillium daleae]KAJ5449933.1 hypothetical protein N7458_006382 [Penicillium daleae]